LLGLEGKTAVVTGAAGDIGGATVLALARQGADVLAVDLDITGLERTAAAAASERGSCTACTADVTSSKQVAAYVEQAVSRWGCVDLFVNNAGVKGPTADLVEYPESAFDEVIAVNVRGVFLGLKHVLPHMPDGSAVVNTASIAGQLGSPQLSAYIASKHAVIGLTRAAALECAARGIRVNAICPGPVDGRMMSATAPGTTGRAGDIDQVPLGRSCAPEEVANLILVLLGDATRYATGACFTLDGGLTAA
jgi:NAD(P)-dependent dehydrogenase (short-subunit alcohol dehydrogenase family)